MRAPTDFLFPDPHAHAGVAVQCVTVCGHLHEQWLVLRPWSSCANGMTLHTLGGNGHAFQCCCALHRLTGAAGLQLCC